MKEERKSSMKLHEYLDGMRAATTADELDAAIQAPFKHLFRGRVWSEISKVRRESAARIVAAHEHSFFIPQIGPRRRLTVCGIERGVGYGQNGTGERWVWTYAQKFAEDLLRRHGFSRRAAHAIWSHATDGYAHRAIQQVEDALDGKMPDPPFYRLILQGLSFSNEPVKVDREYEAKHRDHRPCGCGGTRWHWGSGWSGYATFVNWYCDGCPRVYGEYRA